jgi:hypothetical protein
MVDFRQKRPFIKKKYNLFILGKKKAAVKTAADK